MRTVVLVLLSLLAGSAYGANALSDCAAIESAVERLDCYDRLARTHEPDVSAPADDRVEAPAPTAPAAAEPVVPENPPGPPADTGVSTFGKPPERDPETEVDQIQARIDSVRRSPLGQQIFTLNNGQVWMENEPGGRPVPVGRDVTIRKRFWFYEMDLEDQPDVGVRRLQ